MNPFYERLVIRASTIDELLSDHFEVLPGQKGDIDLAVRRLAAWCRSCASGDWSLFGRRLQRDQLTFPDVLSRFASVRRKACAPMPPWIDDAAWILSVLQERKPASAPPRGQTDPFPFEQLLAPVIERAEAILRSNIDCHAADNLSASAYACLRGALFTELSELAAPPLYELLVKMRKANATWKSSSGPQQPLGISLYQRYTKWLHQSRWLPESLRGKAGPLAFDERDHAAMDRYLARIYCAPRRRFTDYSESPECRQ